MATYRGQDGLVILGGHLIGSPLINGLVSAGASTMNIDDAVSLVGAVAAGDTFTVAAVAGTYTVTNASPVLAVGDAVTGITFTPVAPAGGFPDESAVTFTLQAIGQLRTWNLTAELQALNSTVMRQPASTYRGGLVQWTGQCEGLFDNGDMRQAALLAKIANASPDGTVATLFFGIKDGQAKDLYGAGVLSGFAINNPGQDLASVTFNFQGSATVAIQWN